MNNARIKKIQILTPYFLVIIPIITVIIRAAVSAISYDEAFTYIYYALPLSKDFSFKLLRNFSLNCLANNHWVNTILIALITSLTGVTFNEFVIRFPVVMFGIFFYIFVAICCSKKLITWLEFSVLVFSYYCNEFFGLARGYGICISLVFAALIFYRKYLFNKSFKNLWVCFFILLLSAYANSVSLLVILSIVLVQLIKLIAEKKFLIFLKCGIFQILIYIPLFLYITMYHFRVSNISHGMPLYRAEDVNFIFFIKEYLFLITYHKNFPAFCIFGIVFIGSITTVFYFLKVKIFDSPLAIASVVHFFLLFLIIAIGRGTLTQRLLLPSFPLVILGGGDMINYSFSYLSNSFVFIQKIQKIIIVIFLSLFFCNFLQKVNFMTTQDWFDNYKIRGLALNNQIQKDGNPCWDFYEQQKKHLNDFLVGE